MDIRSKSISLSATVLGTGGGVGYSAEIENRFFDIGVEIEKMILLAMEKNKKILIGIDEISKTKTMIEFVSEYGRWLRAGYPIYLVCMKIFRK